MLLLQAVDPTLLSTSPLRKLSSAVLNGDHLDQHEAGLTGLQGAEVIVKLLRRHRSVKCLVLGHNQLGDDGCVALFDYLGSRVGKKHQITEIDLNGNGIGDAGLLAMARYLEYNKSLGALFIQGNAFQGDHAIMLRFALSVSRSNLHTLSLSCNTLLADAISTTFLPNLTTPRLSELQLSVCSLGPAATPTLVSYLTSPRAMGLHTLMLNGNPLGISSAARIVRALEAANWSVGRVEMHACCLNHTLDEGGNTWREWEEQLRTKVLERNRFLRKRAEEDALTLLIHARPALLASAHPIDGARFRFPPEVVIHILSCLAPSLSPAQYLRVCSYAASPDTLPTIGLNFPPSTPSPSPASLLQFSPHHTCVVNPLDLAGTASTSCPACPRRNSGMFLMKEEHKAWLRSVGCDRFEPVIDRPQEETASKEGGQRGRLKEAQGF